MPEQPELMQERLISGKGVLKVPTDFPKARYYTLYCDVNRRPKNEYLNYNFNPPRSRYATLGFFRNGYLQFSYAVEYLRQSWDFTADITGQNLIAIKCAYDGLLATFTNLALALSETPGSVGLYVLPTIDKIKDYESLNFLFDEIRAVCYADTSIELKIYVTRYDTCDPDKNKSKKPPPPPPPRPPRPPGEPDPDISPPYDPGGVPGTGDSPNYGDDGNTYPIKLDIPEDLSPIDPPVPPEGYCTMVTVQPFSGGSYTWKACGDVSVVVARPDSTRNGVFWQLDNVDMFAGSEAQSVSVGIRVPWDTPSDYGDCSACKAPPP